MSDSLTQMAGQLLLYCPQCPRDLAELWIRDRWRRACESRHWSFLRTSSVIHIPAAYSTGTVSITTGTQAVTGSGTVWTSSHVGMQFKVAGKAPVYTISAVGSNTSLTIDTVWGAPSISSSTYMICQAYSSMPSDFLKFLSCVDTMNFWRMRTDSYTKEDLDRFDPMRSSSGNPLILAAFQNTSTGQAQYEMWPHPVTQRDYPFTYVKRTADFGDSSTLPSILTGDVLVRGALADLCRWPGPSAETRNPMFDLRLSSSYELEFIHCLGEAGRQDNEIYQTDLSYQNWPLAPVNAAFAQSHAMMEPDTFFNNY